MDNLADEILIEILSRLPVKSLMQLKCVKKHYNSLISSPFFVKEQLSRSLQNCHEKLFLASNPLLSTDLEKWHVVTVKRDAATTLGYLARVSDKPTMILGSCHGLICMIFDYEQWILLNPATREFIEIPRPRKYDLRSITESFFGFGYDSSTDEYKLLRGTCSPVKKSSRKPPSLDIFSFKSGSWRAVKEIDFEEYHILGNYNRIGTYYDGRIYWLKEDVTPPYNKYVHNYDGVLSFNLTTNKFCEVIKLPKLDYYGEDRFHIQALSSLGGRLLLYGAAAEIHIQGWILTEMDGKQAWTKVYNHLRKVQPFIPGPKVWSFTRDGKIIVANMCVINWYALQKEDEYQKEDEQLFEHLLDSSVYVESMVSPRTIFRQNQGRMELRPRSKKVLTQTIPTFELNY